MGKVFSPTMKYAILQLHKDVLVRCWDCVREIERLEGQCDPFDLRTWHWLSDVEFDHIHETADDGPHTIENGRPKCEPHHRDKTSASDTHRHHLDRAAKKANGTFKKPANYKPIPAKADHAWPKRQDPWGTQYRKTREQ